MQTPALKKRLRLETQKRDTGRVQAPIFVAVFAASNENRISFSWTGDFPSERSEFAVEAWREGHALLAMAIEDRGSPSPLASIPLVQAFQTVRGLECCSADQALILLNAQTEVSAGRYLKMDLTGRSHELEF
jgi:hypothetical protein